MQQAVTGIDFAMRFFVSVRPQIIGSHAEKKTEAQRPLGTNNARSPETPAQSKRDRSALSTT